MWNRARWGTAGSGNGQFKLPLGIAVDAAGNVYVADAGNDRIQKFTSDGVFLNAWGTFGSGVCAIHTVTEQGLCVCRFAEDDCTLGPECCSGTCDTTTGECTCGAAGAICGKDTHCCDLLKCLDKQPLAGTEIGTCKPAP